MQYADFSVKDFILDEHFQKWVFFKDPDVQGFWENWISRHPEKQEVIEEARQFLLAMDFEKARSSKEDLMEVWENIERANTQLENDTTKSFAAGENESIGRNTRIFKLNFARIAASVLLLLVAGTAIYLSGIFNNRVTYATGYGETQTLVLPDRTRVTLNANSEISFAAGFGQGHPENLREVRLEGEAFFEVTKKNQSLNRGNFIVHTGQINVEVLGTAFNVNNRHGKTQVVLNEGKVRLNPASRIIGDPIFNEAITMEPGDLVELETREKKVVRKKVNPQVYTSWRNNQLVFQQKTIAEIAKVLEDQYGFEVVVEDPSLAKKEFTGTTPLDSVEILFQTMAKSFDLKIEKVKDKVIFKKE